MESIERAGYGLRTACKLRQWNYKKEETAFRLTEILSYYDELW